MRIWRLWSGGLALTLVMILSCTIGLAQVDIFLPGTQPGTYTGNTIDFGVVPVGTTKAATYTFKILETSATAGTVTQIAFSGGFLSAPPFGLTNLPAIPITIPPGGSITFQVTFTPTAIQSYTGQFTITVQGGKPLQVKKQTVTLTGQGVAGTGYRPPTEGEIVPTAPPTTAEVAQLSADLSALSAYVRGELSFAVSGIEEAVSEIQEECCPPRPKLEDYCPGPFPSAGGQRFLEFLNLTIILADVTAEDLMAIQPEDPIEQELLQDCAGLYRSIGSELEELSTRVHQVAPQYLACLDSYIGPDNRDLVYDSVSSERGNPKLKVQKDNSAWSTVKKVLGKAAKWLPFIPKAGPALAALAEDISELIGGANEATKLLVGLGLMQFELEKKLDAIIRGLFGVSISYDATEREVQENLRLVPLENLVKRISDIEGTVGRSEAGLTNLTRMVEKLEKKLCSFIRNLAKELGEAIYGDELYFNTIIPGECGTVLLQPREKKDAIKPEIEKLQGDMTRVKETLERILRELERLKAPPATTDGYPPPEVPPCCALTKKIYVYDEGVFTATAAEDLKVTDVTTAAFDLSGWIDLTEMRDGDAVTVTVEVAVAGGPFRTWSTTTFSDEQGRGLKYFTEFADGLQQVIGTEVKVTIAQTASADEFATPIPIYYQFIVESQN